MPTHLSFQDNERGLPFLINDRIFLGEGLFETMRVANAKVQYAQFHWQRLRKAASFLGLSFEVPLELWLEKLNTFIKQKKMIGGGIKAILSGGSAPRGLLQQAQESHLIFDAFQYVPTSEALTLVSAPWKRDATNPIYQLKSVNYLEAILARRHAHALKADDALFFNVQDFATETTVANIFIIQNNQLVTPSLDSGVLAGILRQRLIDLCKEQNLDCVEGSLDKAQLFQAEGAFTTNVLQGVRPILCYEGISFNVAHPLIQLLQEILRKDEI